MVAGRFRPGCLSRTHRLLAALGLLAATSSAQASLLQLPPGRLQFRVQNWTSNEGLPQNTGCALLQTRDGLMWIGTQGGLCRYDGRHLDVFDTSTGPGLRSNRINCLFEDRDGTLWIGTDQGGLASHRDGRIASITDLEHASVFALGADRHGRLLVASHGRLHRLVAGTLVEVHPELREPVQLTASRSGAVLVVANGGVWRLDDPLDADLPAERLAAGPATCVAEFEGRLVVGTRSGVCALVDGKLQPCVEFPGTQNATLALLVAADGALWVGTETRPVRLDPSWARALATGAPPPPAVEPLPLAMADAPLAAQAFHEDREGGIWIGHIETGVSRLQRTEVTTHASAAGLPPRGMTTVTAGTGGEIYIGATSGLWRKHDGKFDLLGETSDWGAGNGAFRDFDGTLWFGSRRGLARIGPGGQPQLWLEGTATQLLRIRVILRDGDDLLIGGDAGLFAIRERRVIQPAYAAALGTMTVAALAIAPDGALWIGGAARACRIEPDRQRWHVWECGKELPFGEVRCLLPETGHHGWLGSYGGGLVRIDDDTVRVLDKSHGLADQSMCALLRHKEHLLLASNAGLARVRVDDLDAVLAGRATTVARHTLRTIDSYEPECSGGMQSCAAEIDGHIWWIGIQSAYEYDPARIADAREPPPIRIRELFVGDRRTPIQNDLALPHGIRSVTLELATAAFDDYGEVRYRWRLPGVADDWTQASYSGAVLLPDLPPGDLVFEAEAIAPDGRRSGSPARMSLHVPHGLTETRTFRVLAPLAAIALVVAIVRFASRNAAARARRLGALVEERTRELRTAQEGLERRVAERTHELEQALRQQQLDMSERQRLERQLQQFTRMESIGQLAGGIAHDFNNILTVIAGAGQILEQDAASPEARELCANLRRACERGRGLTQHLLAVASRQVVQASRLDLGVVVADLMPMLRALLGEDVTLDFTPPPQPLHVQAAVTQIEQILLNLAGNARDAMPRGGEVAIAIVAEADRVVMTLRDSGIGMPPQVVERAFEPFFSTKGQGTGRGLGLATVYGITKQLGGEAQISSVVGSGTTVTIALPRAAAGPAAAATPRARAATQRIDATILLVEDQAEVRYVLGRMLQRLGCRVIAVDSGDAAVAKLREAPDAVDAVLSDVVMPGLRGGDLVAALHAVRSELPILFSTGYLDGRQVHADLAAMGLEILEKPIDQDVLAATLQRLLPRRPHSS